MLIIITNTMIEFTSKIKRSLSTSKFTKTNLSISKNFCLSKLNNLSQCTYSLLRPTCLIAIW